MAQKIKNVAIAGATGNAGAPIFRALLDSKLFNVTVLTRKGSNHPFPPEVTVKYVDYANVPELTEALKGQDALINATYIAEVVPQINLVDAAIAASVYRYLPSEYGLDTNKPEIGGLPIFEAATAGLKHMHEKCAASGGVTTYTEVHNGGFLDWCFETGFLGILPRERVVTLYDDGSNEIAYTMVEWVGKTVVSVLMHPEETANRGVWVANTYVSQKQLFTLAKEALGAEGWTIKHKNTDEMLVNSMAKLETGDIDLESLLDFIRVADVKYETRWEKDDNELLGIPRLSNEDIKAVIKKYA